ncbi:MAG: L,D-transpeptidase ErfK/SrfK [Blastocatellia bacterium]|nr:L,D-transpeptidase ErfK/SrfK [Blastocatellia bacterium]
MYRFKIHRTQPGYSNRLAALAVLLCIFTAVWDKTAGQTARDRQGSERSDKVTGGHIVRAEFDPNEPDIRITLNVPTFRLTLWQKGREVKSYFVGVGMKEYPIYIGDREATEVIWNPAWIPPWSDWVRASKTVHPGEIIKASDPRNPLGKLKIPLGDSYLIHQAAKPTDLGNLVSHGCVRMLRSDLYDLAGKIMATRNTGVSQRRIEASKRNSRTLIVPLNQPLPVDINYDTIVVEDRVLHIYPDVYDRGTNTAPQLRAELESSSIDVSRLDDQTIRKMFSKATRHTEFVVEINSIEQGHVLEDGRVLPIVRTSQRPRRKR